MLKKGFYSATVQQYRKRRRNRRNQTGELGVYTLMPTDYPDVVFHAYDHQVRAVGTGVGKVGHWTKDTPLVSSATVHNNLLPLAQQQQRESQLQTQSEEVVFQEYVDFFQMDPRVDVNDLHNSSDDEDYSSCTDDDEEGGLYFDVPSLLDARRDGEGGLPEVFDRMEDSHAMLQQMKEPAVTKRDVIRALTPPVDSFLASFRKVGVGKRSRIRGKVRQTGDSIWWRSKGKS